MKLDNWLFKREVVANAYQSNFNCIIWIDRLTTDIIWDLLQQLYL